MKCRNCNNEAIVYGLCKECRVIDKQKKDKLKNEKRQERNKKNRLSINEKRDLKRLQAIDRATMMWADYLNDLKTDKIISKEMLTWSG